MSQVVRAAIRAAMLPCLLAACGSSAPLSSFDSEKSRISGAMPDGVNCTEKTQTSGRILVCRGDGFSAGLIGRKAEDGSDILTADLEASRYFAGGEWPGVSKFVGLYLEGEAVGTCLSGDFDWQGPTHRVRCMNVDSDLRILVEQQKAV